jgi:hypothetical protein
MATSTLAGRITFMGTITTATMDTSMNTTMDTTRGMTMDTATTTAVISCSRRSIRGP